MTLCARYCYYAHCTDDETEGNCSGEVDLPPLYILLCSPVHVILEQKLGCLIFDIAPSSKCLGGLVKASDGTGLAYKFHLPAPNWGSVQ